MTRVRVAASALIVLIATASTSFGYSKPVTYDKDAHTVVFRDLYLDSPHGWIIQKAIDLLRRDGFTRQADVAQKYLLPMLEGVTFNDVWGDADLAGASVLDYYIPDEPGQDFGFGSALFAYKNDTSSFAHHPFYGYQNAAEEAQFRYDYASRILHGHWGDDPRDLMGGWVVDTLLGQDDPQDNRYGLGCTDETLANHTCTSQIDAGGIEHTRFGDRQTADTALADLFLNHSTAQVVFDGLTDPALSTIHVPTTDVVENHGNEWFDDHFDNADDVEAYSGYDGHGSAVYANWTPDAGGSGPNCSGCFLDFIGFFHNSCDAAPMIVRLPVDSPAHAFFQLGWAIHLVEDVTTPVHTIDSSFSTFEVHNDVEAMADRVLVPGSSVVTNDAGKLVRDALGLDTDTIAGFANVYPFPPPPTLVPIGGNLVDVCAGTVVDPAPFFKSRWYTNTLATQAGEGFAHAYTRQAAEISHNFKPFIECINTEADLNWTSMGHFTALGLDLGIKAVAGLLLQFIDDGDQTPPTIAIVQPTATSYAHSATLTLSYGVTDDLSGVASITPTLDGNATVGGHGLASGQAIDLLTELGLGTHTFTVIAVDGAGNPASQSVTFSVIATPASLIDDVQRFTASGAIRNRLVAALLTVDLKFAAAAAAKGADELAVDGWAGFILAVRALSGRGIDPAAASIMIADAQYLIDTTVAADRQLAVGAINAAVAAHGDPRDLRRANDELARGDASVAHGRYGEGILHYREARKSALKAVHP